MSQHSGDEDVNINSVYKLYDVLDAFLSRSTEINVKKEGSVQISKFRFFLDTMPSLPYVQFTERELFIL